MTCVPPAVSAFADRLAGLGWVAGHMRKAWLREQLRARRRGEQVVSPRARTALIAWRDARRTVAGAGCRTPD